MVRVLIIDTHLREHLCFWLPWQNPIKIADLLVVSFLAPLEDYLGLKINTSKDGTVNLRPLVQEVPSLIPGDITSLFQHLSFLFSFKFWILKAQISKITKSRFLYMGQLGVLRTRVLFQPTLLLYRLHWILFQFIMQYSAPKRTLCFINSSLCSRCLKLMGARKNGVCPVLSCYLFLSFLVSYYFQAPAMQPI